MKTTALAAVAAALLASHQHAAINTDTALAAFAVAALAYVLDAVCRRFCEADGEAKRAARAAADAKWKADFRAGR